RTALGCTNAVGSTTGVTPLIDQTLSAGFVIGVASTDPLTGVAEHPHPGRILAPLARMPRHLHAAKRALGMRHEDRESSIGGREPGDSVRRAARIVRIALGR